jgi:hypothetical protein
VAMRSVWPAMPICHEVRIYPYDRVEAGFIFFNLLGALEVGGVSLAPDHWSEALGGNSGQGASRLVDVTDEFMAQIMGLAGSPRLIIKNVGACIDWLAVGCGHVLGCARLMRAG